MSRPGLSSLALSQLKTVGVYGNFPFLRASFKRASRRARSLVLRGPLRWRDSAMSIRRCSRRIRRAPMIYPFQIVIDEENEFGKHSLFLCLIRQSGNNLIDIEDAAGPGASAGMLERRPQPRVGGQMRI